MKCLIVVSILFAISGTAAGQDQAIIDCQDRTSIPAWEKPGSIVVLRQLSCDQEVTVLGLEQGYVNIQIGQQIAYVDAKYVRVSKSRVQRPPQPQAPEKELERQKTILRPPTPKPESPAPTAESKPAPAMKPQVPEPSYETEEPRPNRHRIGLNFELSNIYYDEPNFMRNKGFMYGVSGDYTFHPNSFMFRFDGRFSLGNMDYWSHGTGQNSGIRDYNTETRFSFGREFRPLERASFTPFIGFGYRRLADLSGGLETTSGAHGYDRKSNYLYSPIGLDTMFHVKNRWSLGLTGEYDLFWHGWQYSELGSTVLEWYVLALPDFVAKNDQLGGYGARGSVKLIRNFGRIDFKFEPYFRYWSINGSDLFQVLGPTRLYTVQEPANTTTEWGFKCGITF